MQAVCAGSPSNQDISIASDMEMERVFTLLSNESPHNYEQSYGYDGRREMGYQRERTDGRRGDDYPLRGGEGYGYGYSSREYSGYRGEGGRQGRRYAEEEPKERGDNSSSGSSGIEDPYSRRSRSSSAASQHADSEGGRGRGGDTAGGGAHRAQAGSSASLGSMDSGFGGVVHHGQERGRAEGGEGPRTHSQDLPFDFSKGLGSLIPTNPHRSYDYMFEMGR